ncbi:Muconate cycloisomerase 1, partial [Aureobasidium melanogenum]|uniref:Muconate cycloisomerase 1 n=1 Tax=Aureobasidium melanogenum (strain CBS 110374) TaxID=1043003 RepID=A0A074W415_AURM1
MDFLVGTFYTPKLFTLRFTPSKDISKCKLEIAHTSEAIGGHSWLSLSSDKKHLYTTVWASPPAVAAYRVEDNHTLTPLNSKPVRSMSGYVCSSNTTLYSAGGPTGEVFSILSDGSIGPLIQNLEFRNQGNENDGARNGVAHGDFGGLRHGAHSVDLSPDGKALYIADIGHNCIWNYAISSGQGKLEQTQKWIASRENDGPRHAWPHPNGKILYSVQEHSCYVDALSISETGTLDLVSGKRIIPEDKDEKKYWADEVRLSRPTSGRPKYLYASTRGLEKETKGYVAVFELDEEGLLRGEAIDIFETATSGGIANAIEPAPMVEGQEGVEYLAMTDSQEGYVFMLAFDGKKIREIARTQLLGEDGNTLAAATAVWL